eukprot:261980-Amorphochlora_amoeboformis.AAC.2
MQTEIRKSNSYPGLDSLYDLHQVGAVIPCLPTGKFQTTEGHPGTLKRIFWGWHDTRLSPPPMGKHIHPGTPLYLLDV